MEVNPPGPLHEYVIPFIDPAPNVNACPSQTVLPQAPVTGEGFTITEDETEAVQPLAAVRVKL